jgi:peptide/nickel transport system permease protein
MERGLMGLRGYILKRILYMVALIFFVITINFFIFMLMPGDPAAMLVNPQSRFVKEELAAARRAWGLDEPIYVRYVKYAINLLTWHFGKSIATSISIASEMAWRLPYTLFLMGGSTILSMIIGILLGVLAAHKRGSRFDDVNVVFSLAFYSLPVFWMGMVFLLIFAKELGWFPMGSPFPVEWLLHPPSPAFVFDLFGLKVVIPTLYELFVRLKHFVLPLATLTLFQYGGWLLLTRATMLETLTEDYILTAKAKGVKTRTVLLKHALKNASLPLITTAALSFGFLVGGAIITETVYNWPGMGGWIYQAISGRDYPVLQAIFFIIALCVVIANFIADLLYGIIDPRIKYD